MSLCWITDGQGAPLEVRTQYSEGAPLMCDAIIKDEVVGSFQVEDGLKISSQASCQFFWNTFYKKWCIKLSVESKKEMTFMQENAQSHPSDCLQVPICLGN